jgi:hypothetical protein
LRLDPRPRFLGAPFLLVQKIPANPPWRSQNSVKKSDRRDAARLVRPPKFWPLPTQPDTARPVLAGQGADDQVRSLLDRLSRPTPTTAFQPQPMCRQPCRQAPLNRITHSSRAAGVRIRALTGRRWIGRTSTGSRSSRPPKPGRGSTYKTRKTVQMNWASSVYDVMRRVLAISVSQLKTSAGVAPTASAAAPIFKSISTVNLAPVGNE